MTRVKRHSEDIIKGALGGKSIKEIATEYEVSDETIRSILREAGYKKVWVSKEEKDLNNDSTGI